MIHVMKFGLHECFPITPGPFVVLLFVLKKQSGYQKYVLVKLYSKYLTNGFLNFPCTVLEPCAKSQLIYKGLFGTLNFSKK